MPVPIGQETTTILTTANVFQQSHWRNRKVANHKTVSSQSYKRAPYQAGFSHWGNGCELGSPAWRGRVAVAAVAGPPHGQIHPKELCCLQLPGCAWSLPFSWVSEGVGFILAPSVPWKQGCVVCRVTGVCLLGWGILRSKMSSCVSQCMSLNTLHNCMSYIEQNKIATILCKTS